MANRFEVYKCGKCGNIVEVLFGSKGTLNCCGAPMNLCEENTTEAATEKHIPVIEKIENGFLVKVGEVDHPMVENHYIEWIELIDNDKVYRAFLKPNDTPQATFTIEADQPSARAYCNLHGLWKS